MQKKAHNEIEGTGESYLGKYKWWAGMMFVLISQPLYIIALSMTKQSILGVVGPFGIVANIILARYFLEEKIRIFQYIAMALLVPGTILTLAFSSLENDRYNRREFNYLFYSNQSKLYLMFSFIALVIMMSISHLILTRNSDEERDSYMQQIDDNDYHFRRNHALDIMLKPEQIKRTSKNDPLDLIGLGSSSNKTIFEYLFGSPRLRFIPLLVFPYFGPFFTSLSCMFVRCINGFAIAEPDKQDESNFYGVMPIFYILCIPI